MSPVIKTPAFRYGRRLLGGLLLTSLSMASAPALADFNLSDCKRGVRDATATEIAFSHRAPAAVAAYLPRPPQFMTLLSAFDFKQPPPAKWQTCKEDREGQGLGAKVGATYRLQYPREETDRLGLQVRALKTEIARIEALPPEKEAQRKALDDQARAAYAAAPRRNRKDPPFTPEQQALADKQYAEGKRLEDAARRVTLDHEASVKPQTDPLKAQRDSLSAAQQDFAVRIEVNSWHLDSADGLQWGARRPDGGFGANVGNVVVRIEGPAGPARDALLASIDRAGLQGLVGKPPPVPAQSEAIWTAAQAKPPLDLPRFTEAVPTAQKRP